MSEITKIMDEIAQKYPTKRFDGYTQGGAELYDLIKELEAKFTLLNQRVKAIEDGMRAALGK